MKYFSAILAVLLLAGVSTLGQTIPDEPQPIPNSYDGTLKRSKTHKVSPIGLKSRTEA
jgi:hypothetical protein